MIKIHSPKKNLGCLGLETKKVYFDFFKNPYLGCFANIAGKQFWIGIDLRSRLAFFRIEHVGMIKQGSISMKKVEFLSV